MRRTVHRETVTTTNAVTTTTSTPFSTSRAKTLSVQSVIDVNTPASKAFAAGTNEVQTLTFADKATSVHQDFFVVEDTAAVKYAIALTKPVAEVQTLTFPSVAASTGGDYVVLTDGAGLTWAIALNKSGTDPAPTGALYTAVDAARKVNVDISGGTTAASVAALVETAFDALTGSSAIVTDDTAADGTMTLTMATKAPCTNPVPKNANDSGAGSITGIETTAGVASVAPSGLIWTAATYKGLADISADTTAANVAARVETALNLLTGFTTAITTSDTAADGTMTLTSVIRAPVTNPVLKDAAESGAGTILGVQTTGGAVSDVDVTANTIAETTHGFTTGLKGQASTTGTLPAGLSLTTDYFVIATTVSTYKLATSLANAIAGTAIDITDQGSSAATHTFTPTSIAGASITLQKSNNYDPIAGTGDFDAVETATSITADGDIWISDVDPEYEYARLSFTLTAGSLSASSYIITKEDM